MMMSFGYTGDDLEKVTKYSIKKYCIYHNMLFGSIEVSLIIRSYQHVLFCRTQSKIVLKTTRVNNPSSSLDIFPVTFNAAMFNLFKLNIYFNVDELEI